MSEKGSLIIDAGSSPAHLALFLDALEHEQLPPPRYAVLTHWHWDHVFGAQGLGVPILAYRGTARRLRKQAILDWSDEGLDQRVQAGLESAACVERLKAAWPDRTDLRIVIPDILFNADINLDMGDVLCEIVHVGGDHAPDSSVIYVQDDRVMFLGDALAEGTDAPQPYYTTARLLPLLDRILSFNAELFIDGHGETVLRRDELQAWADDMNLIGALVQRYGTERASIIADLKIGARRLSNKAHVRYVDRFIAGLSVETSV